jgi:hypothetical protein
MKNAVFWDVVPCRSCELLSVVGLLMWDALSDERGRVRRLQLLLALVSAVFSGPSPAGLKTIFYCLRFETAPTWRARSSYSYPPGTGWPSYTHSHWVPFSSPTTRRVFEPASRRGSTNLLAGSRCRSWTRTS